MAGGRIKGITIEINGDATKLTESLKQVDSQLQKSQSKLKDVNKLLKLDPGNTELLKQKYKDLESSIKSTEDRLKTLKTASEEAAKTAGNYDAWKAKYDPIQQEISETQEKLKKLKEDAKDADQQLASGQISKEKYDAIQAEIKETSDHLKDLKQQAEAVDEEFGHPLSQEQWDALQREIADTETQLRSLNTEMENFGSVSAQSIAAAGEKVKDVGDKITDAGKAVMPASIAMIGAGTAAATKFAEVDKIMQLTNATMGNTEEQAALLEKAMAEAAANSTFSMSDAANATLNFARAGLDAEQAAAALAPAMNLAAGEGGNLDTVSAGLVATINGFGDAFDGERGAAHYADVFAAACNNSALDVDSLSHAMSVAAPIFKTAGYSVEDAALYMGVMANNGIDADKAANSLKTGLARLVSPAKDGAEMMAKLGISVTNADGTMKDCITIQRELHDKFADLSEAEQIAAASAIFGKNQMVPWLALINTAPEDVGELNASLRDCAGTTDEMAEAMMSGFGGSIEKLKSSLDVLMTTLGKVLAEYLTPIIQGIQGFVDWLNSLDEGTRKLVVTIGMLIAAAGPVLIFVGKLTSAVGSIMTWAPKIVTGIGKLKSLLSGLWATLAANPIVLIIAGITALVAAFIYFWNTSEEFRQFWIDLWAAIQSTAEAVWEAITSFFSSAWEGIKATAEAIWSAVTEFFANAWNNIRATAENVWSAISQFFSGLWATISATAQTIWNGISDFFSGLWTTISSTAESAWNALGDFFSGLWTTISTAVETAWNAIADFFSGLWTTISTAAETAWNGISEFFTGLWNTISTTAQTIWNGIADFFSGLWTTISTTAETSWNAISDFFTGMWEGIKTKAEEVWNGIKDIISTVTDAISSTAQEKWDNIKAAYDEHGGGLEGAVAATWEAIKSAYTFGFDAIDKLTGGKLEGIKTMFTDAWEAVKTTVKNAVDKLLGFLDFHWELPKIALPHFSIRGSFSLNPPSVPHLSVEWYKKAMDNGMILTSPTIFGMSGGKLLGGGDAGPEAIIGTSALSDLISDAVARANVGQTYSVPRGAGQSRIINVAMYIKDTEIGRVLVPIIDAEEQRVGVKLTKGGTY